MTTVNALKCKHPENEAKMHFTYLWQCLAHSNSTSKHQENPMSTYHLLSPYFYLQSKLSNIK